jgi:hypothetical protein
MKLNLMYPQSQNKARGEERGGRGERGERRERERGRSRGVEEEWRSERRK